MYYITYYGEISKKHFIVPFRKENIARSYICCLRTINSIYGWSYSKFKFHIKYPKGLYESKNPISETRLYDKMKLHVRRM